MKTWIKILVAVCVILVICISVWAIFFKEKDEVQAYNRTAELIDYKQSLGLTEKLNELKDMNYLHNDSSVVISSINSTGAKIIELRRIMLGDGLILGYGDNQFYSYLTMEEYLDEILEYYLPYMKGDRVKSKQLKSLKDDIEDYIRTLKKLDESLDKLFDQQIAMDGSVESDYEPLFGYYEQVQEKYRLCLTYSSNVVMSVMNYIDKSIFDDNMLIDTKTAFYDAFARALNTASSVEIKLEPDYANDVKIIMDKIDALNADIDVFTADYNEYNFLQSYNKLYNNYSEVLDYVFACKNLEKAQMAEGFALGSVLENARQPIITALNVLGF